MECGEFFGNNLTHAVRCCTLDVRKRLLVYDVFTYHHTVT